MCYNRPRNSELHWTVKEFNAAAKDADKARAKARREYENSHPNRAKINALLNELNEIQRQRMLAGNKMSFTERMAHPLFIEVKRLQDEMRNDINTRYPEKIK